MVKVYNKRNMPISVSGTMINPKQEVVLTVGYDSYLRRLEYLGFISVKEINNPNQLSNNGIPESYVAPDSNEVSKRKKSNNIKE